VRSLRVYLLILVLGAMLPGTLLTGLLVWRAFDNDRTAGERRLQESARVDAAALDREFAATIGALEALATSPTLDHDDLPAFHAEGRRIQATQPGWYTILLVSLDGRPVVNTRLQWGTPLIPAAELDSLRGLVETGRPTIGTVRQPPRGGPEHTFAVRVPVVRGGMLKYALSAIVNVDSLARVVPRQLANSEEWTRTILDPSGTIAVRTRGAEDYIGTPATAAFRERIRRAPESVTRETTREGVAVYAATSRSAYGWTTVVVVPAATLDGAVMASMTAILTGGALLMMCGLAAVLLVSRRLSADLAAATRAAEAVAEGQPVGMIEGHVSETRRLQRSLASAASLLDRRARERDDQIRRTEAARVEAEHANQTKDQFLAVLGHELRNPLAPALTALELMRVRRPDVFTREREILERQVAHMTRLVNDLLDVSRLARGRIEVVKRRFELREAVDRALDMVQPLIAQKQHTLHVSVPASGLVIDGDVHRIVQVLCNLLTNAAKYTPPAGHIALTASASNDQVRIECQDNGPGVPAELVPNLFDRFAQGPRTLDRREGGLGLGLALARSFAELHGGTVSLEAPPSGSGSRFVVTLPLVVTHVDVPVSVQHANPVATGTSRRVLLVEDNDDAREMLRSALGHAGHLVAAAASASEAISLSTVFQPDVGVFDIGLPGMNGYELAREVRKSNVAIRLIALTGYGQLADVDAARSAGFDAHCTKPVTTITLLGLIEGGSGAPDRTLPQQVQA
jgi:signal transduction histidine kinase/ActR/RegA family two-component response regulator